MINMFGRGVLQQLEVVNVGNTTMSHILRGISNKIFTFSVDIFKNGSKMGDKSATIFSRNADIWRNILF